MEIFGFLKNIFKKKLKNVGYWYMIDFSEAAKEFSVGNDFCKKVYEMYNDNFTGNEWDYTEAKVKILERNDEIVVDMTKGLEVSAESTFMPRTRVAFGTIQLSKRVY